MVLLGRQLRLAGPLESFFVSSLIVNARLDGAMMGISSVDVDWHQCLHLGLFDLGVWRRPLRLRDCFLLLAVVRTSLTHGYAVVLLSFRLSLSMLAGSTLFKLCTLSQHTYLLWMTILSLSRVCFVT